MPHRTIPPFRPAAPASPRRALALALAVVVGTLGGLAPSMAGAVQPRGTVQVNEEQVRLGDLFDALSPEKAAIVVATAPSPGRRMSLDALALARIASTYGVPWQPAGDERVVVERSSVEITSARIQAALNAAAVKAGAPAGTEVQLDNANLALQLPASGDTSIGFNNVSYDATRGRVVAELVIPAQGEPVFHQAIAGRAMVMLDLPVLNRRVQPGDVISDADITWTKIARDRLTGDVVLSGRDIVGRTVRHAVVSDQPLRASDLRAPVVVNRGSLVTIMLQTAAMTLTVQGKAMGEGGVGDVIPVMNTASNRQVDATVGGPGLVMVQVNPYARGLPLAPPQRTALN